MNAVDGVSFNSAVTNRQWFQNMDIMGDIFKYIPIMVVIIALITIIISIKKANKKPIVSAVITCILNIIIYWYIYDKSIHSQINYSEIMYVGDITYTKYWLIHVVTIVVIIIIQLIPFIICLKNNKKVKKDEVKQ